MYAKVLLYLLLYWTYTMGHVLDLHCHSLLWFECWVPAKCPGVKCLALKVIQGKVVEPFKDIDPKGNPLSHCSALTKGGSHVIIDSSCCNPWRTLIKWVNLIPFFIISERDGVIVCTLPHRQASLTTASIRGHPPTLFNLDFWDSKTSS